MFLFQLDTTERECFLELAWHLVAADGQLGDAEKEIFQSYVNECELPGFKPAGKPIGVLLDVLKQSPKDKRRIVCVELFGIVMADRKYQQGEKELMKRIGESFVIGATEIEQLKDWGVRFTAIIAEGQKLIQK